MQVGEDVFRTLPRLQTERLVLRPVRSDDAADIFSFTCLPQTSELLSWEPHSSLAVTQGFVDSVLEKYAQGLPAQWAVTRKDSGRVIGMAGFISFSAEHRKGEVAFVLDPREWGRGLMTEAITGIANLAFDTWGLVRVEAKCETDNSASEKVIRRCGLELEGVFRHFLLRKGLHRDYKYFAAIRP